MVQKIIPNLWFDTQAEEAANFYVSKFRNSKVNYITNYTETGSRISGMPAGSVMTVEFELAGQRFIGLNGGPVFQFTPAISFFIGCKTEEEVNHLYDELSEKGKVLMPLGKYPFNDRYAWVTDRYGVSWQLFFGSRKQKFTPCLMFIHKQYGKAQEAMKFYISIFDKSKIENLVTYDKGDNEKEGTVKHASFYLNGEQFIVMDSGMEHNFTFTPAISFMVECENQNEIDQFWKKLSAVPEAEQCGWLQDKYGVSWQIVPTILDKLLKDKDPEKSKRVMNAMIEMRKFDIATLLKAYENG